MAETTAELTNFYGERIDPLLESMFPDGFLNFGYWKDGRRTKLDIQDRVTSGKELYRQVLDELQISSNDKVLEVGCGRGRGAALAAMEYLPAEVHGVDAVDRQVEKAMVENALAIRASDGRLSYRQGTASTLPYVPGYFDKIYSVEAMIHFPDLAAFVREIARVTREKATISVASVFSPARAIDADQWVEVLSADEAPPSAIHAHSVSALVDALTAAEFNTISIRSIGGYVWRGFNRYLDHLGVPERSKRRNWQKAHEQKILDYYVITARKGW